MIRHKLLQIHVDWKTILKTFSHDSDITYYLRKHSKSDNRVNLIPTTCVYPRGRLGGGSMSTGAADLTCPLDLLGELGSEDMGVPKSSSSSDDKLGNTPLTPACHAAYVDTCCV